MKSPNLFRHPTAPTPAPELSWEDQKKADALAYLNNERALINDRTRLGLSPLSYMPTVIGEVRGGRIPIDALTRDELWWWADEAVRQRREAEHWPDGDPNAVAAAQTLLALAANELTKRGVSYSEPPDIERAPTTVPNVPRPDGR